MKHILCYGDSNTHGYNPYSKGRYDINERWTGVLQELLGSEYRIIEEGLNSRTTVLDDPIDDYRNGKTFLTPCIKTHYPLDLIIIMLGSNDMKSRYNMTATEISKGVCKLVEIAQSVTSSKSPDKTPSKILLVSPIHIGEKMLDKDFGEEFGCERSYNISRKLAEKYEKVADSLGVYFMDASQYAEPCELDGLHMTKEEHKKLALAFCNKIKEII